MGRQFFSYFPNFDNTNKDARAPIPEKQLRELFESCDTNRDRKLSKAELKVAFNKLGALIPRYRAHQGMANTDVNGDGVIDLDNKELDGLVDFASNLGYTLKN